ncbi:hypothetical protein L6452_28693 [Arctium lappa]|uniref:Uncharacterized protein n=1 Tax=Arctium lappa TaxID=4217 RepID=A0ACB9A005_ARCLA|nr:hypothetical protein L6452_28693 [Arctium lappa]
MREDRKTGKEKRSFTEVEREAVEGNRFTEKRVWWIREDGRNDFVFSIIDPGKVRNPDRHEQLPPAVADPPYRERRRVENEARNVEDKVHESE